MPIAKKRANLRQLLLASSHNPFDNASEIQTLDAPMPDVPQQFAGVTVATRANVYFDGRVVSHSITFPDQSRKTLGLIFPGKFHFGTQAAEIMEIVNGSCGVTLDGGSEKRNYTAGQRFEVPANSGFTIEVTGGICEYICSFVS